MLKVFHQKESSHCINGKLVDAGLWHDELNLCRHTFKFIAKKDLSLDASVDETYVFDTSITIKEEEVPWEL